MQKRTQQCNSYHIKYLYITKKRGKGSIFFVHLQIFA